MLVVCIIFRDDFLWLWHPLSKNTLQFYQDKSYFLCYFLYIENAENEYIKCICVFVNKLPVSVYTGFILSTTLFMCFFIIYCIFFLTVLLIKCMFVCYFPYYKIYHAFSYRPQKTFYYEFYYDINVYIYTAVELITKIIHYLPSC